MEIPELLIYSIDIEVIKSKGFPSVKEATDPIVIISLYDSQKKKTVIFGEKPYNGSNGDVIYIEVSDEKVLLRKFFMFMHKYTPDVITGWNCIYENENIWLDNKILKIKNLKLNDITFKYGKIKNHFKSNKKGVILELVNGSKIISSKDHIFPIYSKYKNNYKNTNSLLKTLKNLEVENIDIEKDNFLKVFKGNNKNDSISYRNLIIKNFDVFKKYDNFNFILHDKNILNFIKSNHKDYYKKIMKIDYYGKKIFTNTTRFNFKNFIDILPTSMVLSFLKENNFIDFLFTKKRTKIDISKKIDHDILRIIGLIFTDGHYYKKSYNIDNTDYNLIKDYVEILKKKCNYSGYIEKCKKILDIHSTCYRISCGMNNIISLMYPLIYDNHNKKRLMIEVLSTLSKKQFLSFFSGLIDGDGYIMNNGMGFCNYENIENISIIQELLLWNYGVYSIDNKNKLYIPLKYKSNQLFLKDIVLYNIKRKEKLNNILNKCIIFKNSISNNIKVFEYNSFYIVKIKNITYNKNNVDMYDIETDGHYFSVKGIKSHNCYNFDMAYIINRTKTLFGQETDLYEKMSPINIVRTWKQRNKDEMNIDIAGIHIIDYMDLYKWYTPTKLERYSLDFVSNFELEKGKMDYSDYNNLRELYEKNWDKFVEYNITDAKRVDQLEEKLGYIKLIQALSLLTKCPMKFYDKMTSLIEGALLTYYRRNNMCAPFFAGGTQEGYPAAYVKEPISGMYNWVLSMDIASSYPSHIITLNMSNETYFGRIVMDEEEVILNVKNKYFSEFEMMKDDGVTYFEGKRLDGFNKALKRGILSVAPCGTVFTNTKPGILSMVEKNIFIRRKEVKQRMKDLKKKGGNEERVQQLHATQNAMKTVLNAVYGITAVPYSRYFNINISEAVTSCGRHTIKQGEKFINELLNNPTDELEEILNNV